MKNSASHSSRSKLIQPEKPTLIVPETSTKLILPDAPKGILKPTIDDMLRIGNLDGEFSYLTFPGIMPLSLADGTKIAILPDIHCPAHDHEVMWAVKLALRDYQPDVLIFIGDVADCFAVGRWPADTGVVRNIQTELDETRELIDELREISGAKWTFVIMGNHEDRFARYMVDVAPALANIINPFSKERSMTVHDLMGYGPKDNITFIYDMMERGGFGGGLLANDHFYWLHGMIADGKPTASPRKQADKNGVTTQSGHTHRAGFVVRETGDTEVMGSEIGHLIKKNHPYVGYSNLRNNHQQAIALATVVGGKVHPETYPILDMEIDGAHRKVLTIGDKSYLASDR